MVSVFRVLTYVIRGMVMNGGMAVKTNTVLMGGSIPRGMAMTDYPTEIMSCGALKEFVRGDCVVRGRE